MLLTIMEKAGSYTLKYLIPLLKVGVVMIMGVPKEVRDLVEKREKIRVRIRETDRAAAAEEGDTREGKIRKATQLRTIDFRIEDVIDEWDSCSLHERFNGMENIKAVDEGQPRNHGCVVLPCENANFGNIMCRDRLRIALEIQKIKSDLAEIIEGSERDGIEISSSSEQGGSSSMINPDIAWKNLRRNHIYRSQTKAVGFEAASAELIGWLEDERAECTVMVVVGMAGQGKTTLAREILVNTEVIGKFNCSAWINVSDFDDPNEFFWSLLRKLRGKTDGFSTMDPESLKNEVEKYLSERRYVLFFDDVWNKNFWQQIKDTVSINGNRSRIIITTRNKEVAKTCQLSTIDEVKVHEMQPLTKEKSLELFCQTAFRFGSSKGHCPKKFENLSSEVVEICEGLPLGIVAIGKHLSVYTRDALKWKSKIEEAGITKILCLSYDNLPYHLQPCLLYFGIYPQDYKVESKRLIRQWIAEGFVKSKRDKTLEEVAEDYLTSLINRNLVQVSSFPIDDEPRSCRVHYLVHDMILRKFEDLSFCRCINEANRLYESGLTRRLSIATNSIEELPMSDKDESSFIRSLHLFTKEELPEHLVSKIPAKYRTLKVLDFENSQLSCVPENLGDLIHLKYLSFRKTGIQSLPKSIGELQNLETLDLRGTGVHEMPKEVSKLRKLRHLLASVQLKDSFGGMTSLQTIHEVRMDDAVGLIEKELGKLWRMRDLRLSNVGEEHGSALCSSINKMQYLEKLHIVAKAENEVIDLQGLKQPPMLQKLHLQGKLNQLPEWAPGLEHLVKLILSGSRLTHDPLNSLKNLPNLLFLSITEDAYIGESLHFQDEYFEDLVKLELGSLQSLSSITIDSKALPSLKKLQLWDILQLKEVPTGIQHLKKLQLLSILRMPPEFAECIGGKEGWFIHHVPHVQIDGELLKDKKPRQ